MLAPPPQLDNPESFRTTVAEAPLELQVTRY
jgi:hypothetical protein